MGEEEAYCEDTSGAFTDLNEQMQHLTRTSSFVVGPLSVRHRSATVATTGFGMPKPFLNESFSLSALAEDPHPTPVVEVAGKPPAWHRHASQIQGPTRASRTRSMSNVLFQNQSPSIRDFDKSESSHLPTAAMWYLILHRSQTSRVLIQMLTTTLPPLEDATRSMLWSCGEIGACSQIVCLAS